MDRFKGFSASFLKIIAMITMFIDHSAVGLLEDNLIRIPNIDTSQIYFLMRNIGRIAFPIYLFLLIEGYHRTKDVKKYITRLLIFALISEMPFNYVLSGRFLNFDYQNIFFELALLMIMFHMLNSYEDNKLLSVGIVCLIAVISTAIRADYLFLGIIAGAVMYYGYGTRKNRAISTVIGFLFEAIVMPLVLISPILIYFYNGEKGKSLNKYFYYAFYPGHLALIGIVKYILINGLV